MTRRSRCSSCERKAPAFQCEMRELRKHQDVADQNVNLTEACRTRPPPTPFTFPVPLPSVDVILPMFPDVNCEVGLANSGVLVILNASKRASRLQVSRIGKVLKSERLSTK